MIGMQQSPEGDCCQRLYRNKKPHIFGMAVFSLLFFCCPWLFFLISLGDSFIKIFWLYFEYTKAWCWANSFLVILTFVVVALPWQISGSSISTSSSPCSRRNFFSLCSFLFFCRHRLNLVFLNFLFKFFDCVGHYPPLFKVLRYLKIKILPLLILWNESASILACSTILSNESNICWWRNRRRGRQSSRKLVRR